MPPKWWLRPSAGSNAEETFGETARIMSLFTHHHLLVQLHLPYLLRFSTDRKYDYSKITAVNASREILSLFVSFRGSNPGTYYCRGVDFLVFIASTVLCIAHIENRRQRHLDDPNTGYPRRDNFFNFLMHQRLADRGMMESTLESMESMALDGTDKVTSRITSILRYLLDIEDDAAGGGTYNTSSSSGSSTDREEWFGCSGHFSDGKNILRIYIPYFGNIKIEHSGVSKSSLTGPEISGADPTVSLGTTVQTKHQNVDRQQSQPPAQNPAGDQVDCHATNPGWQAVPCQIGSEIPSERSNSPAKNNSAPGFQDTNDAHLLVPGLAADTNDWALQGVDMAFFDSLLCGTTIEEDLPI